jgi:hypothetical protein
LVFHYGLPPVSGLLVFYLQMALYVIGGYLLQLSSSSSFFTPIFSSPLYPSPSPLLKLVVKLLRLPLSSRLERNHFLFSVFRSLPPPLSPLDAPLSMNTPFHRSCYITRSFDRLHRCPFNLSLKSSIRSTRLLLDIVIVFIYVYPWCVLLRCRAVAEVGGSGGIGFCGRIYDQ